MPRLGNTGWDEGVISIPKLPSKQLNFNSNLAKGLARLARQVKTADDFDNPKGSVVESAEENNVEFLGIKADNAKMWAQYGHTFTPCEKAIPELLPGQYTIGYHDSRGIFFEKKEVILDELLVLPDTVSQDILEHIQDFWGKEKRYRDLGFLWKRGVLLWGPPGSGKTSTVQLLSEMIINKGGLAIYISSPELAARGLDLLRRIEPNRPIVAILEDLDAIIGSNRHVEADLLSLIDGELQIDNIVFVATTNYPEELDKRITNRPSRFDVVKEIGMPSGPARYMFLKSKNPRLAKDENKEELDKWVNISNKFSIAHLKEMIICVECYEQPLEDVAKRLKKMIEVDLKSESQKKLGFSDD